MNKKEYTVADIIQVQQAYWTDNVQEKATLLAGYPDALTWDELFRLHHLNCLELLKDKSGKLQPFGAAVNKTAGESYDLHVQLIQRLLLEQSPYRPRKCSVWQRRDGDDRKINRKPDRVEVIRNASVTHLGSLEVIRLEQDREPEIAFLPFANIRHVGFGDYAPFMWAQVMYEGEQRQERVLIPLLYGISLHSDQESFRNGSMTMLCGDIHIEGYDYPFGVGIGHQDFFSAGTLYGLGSVAVIRPVSQFSELFDFEVNFN